MSVALFQKNNVITESACGNRFLFQGREYDYDTALYYFRNRWYEPETGRWLSPDPIGISGGLNLYAFCGNDPVNFVDPMGLAIVKNRTGRPVIVSGNIGDNRGTGSQYYAVIPPNLNGEDKAWGGSDNPISVYQFPGEAIAAYFGCPHTPIGVVTDIDFVPGYADAPYEDLNCNISALSPTKMFGSSDGIIGGIIYVLTQDESGNIVMEGDKWWWDSLKIGFFDLYYNRLGDGPRYFGYGGRLPF
ncbi:MAG: RHS repeat-associated core domain-containing protein [Verrucomicrobia bacterium]|nr:RHS repeat-associated core domain-containing protein [Verrucomicrobiota bacterium]